MLLRILAITNTTRCQKHEGNRMIAIIVGK
jgi:hypothetical protein